jgi:hypothetical protein
MVSSILGSGADMTTLVVADVSGILHLEMDPAKICSKTKRKFHQNVCLLQQRFELRATSQL